MGDAPLAVGSNNARRSADVDERFVEQGSKKVGRDFRGSWDEARIWGRGLGDEGRGDQGERDKGTRVILIHSRGHLR